MSNLPCINCITLAMCKSRYDQRFKEMVKVFPQHSPKVAAIFLLVSYCSILKDYCEMTDLSITGKVIDEVSSFYSDIKGQLQ